MGASNLKKVLLLMLSQVKAHLGIILVLVVYLAMTVYTNLRVPLHLGSDEVAHFMFARFLRQNGYLPVTMEDRLAAGYKSDQPPLNSMVVALAYGWGDLGPPLVKLTEDQPRRQLSVIADNYVGWQQALNTEDPWTGEVLFWRVGRFVSTFFGAATLLVIYLTALVIFSHIPYQRRWALAAVMSVAFIPTFVLVSGVFSYESLLGFWLALYLLTAVYIVKNPLQNRLYLLAGLFIGLAIATKLSAVVAPLGLAGLVLTVGFQQRWRLSDFIKRLGLSLLGVMLGAGWWFGLVLIDFNRVSELGWGAGLLAPIIKGDGSDPTAARVIGLFSGAGGELPALHWSDVSMWGNLIFTTFWRYRDQGAGPETGPIFLALKLVTGFIVVGLVRVWVTHRQARLWLGLLLLQIVVFSILPLVRLVFTGPGGDGHNGHHILFPAAGAFAVLMVWGFSGLFPRQVSWRYGGSMVLAVGLLGWSIVRAVQIYYPPLPVRTVPPLLPVTAQSTLVDFGPVALVGFQLNGLTVSNQCCRPNFPALGVNLYWQAVQYSQQDYLTEVKLVDQSGLAQSVWLGYSANGRYPTRAWDPGDTVRDEVWLPLAGLPPGPYTLTLRLLQADDLQPVDNEAGVALMPLILTTPPPPSASTVTVWQQGQPAAFPQFATWNTIQLTAPSAEPITLVGPDETVHAPLLVAGDNYLFIVDPRWPKRVNYRVQFQPAGQPARQTEPLLYASGRGRPTIAPPSQVAVNANFAHQLTLLGYDLPQRRFQPGAEIPILLRFQALKTMPVDFLMFTRLRDATGQVWGGRDRKPQESYSTLFWTPGEVVENGFTVKIQPDAPPGIYTIDLGFYFTVDKAPVSLPLVQNGQLTDVTSVTLGPIKIGDTLPDLTVAAPRPQIPTDEAFGNASNLTLLGFNLTDNNNQPVEPPLSSIQNLKLTLYWQVESPLPLNYTTFVHVRNSAGQIAAQKDQPPLNGAYPTSLWDAGETIADEITIPLPPNLPSDTYALVVGLYDYNTGQRLIVPGNPANEVTLITVRAGE
jgi:4-amino-4-deoxy-L-arabinose transferase-like glycosyltransferase